MNYTNLTKKIVIPKTKKIFTFNKRNCVYPIIGFVEYYEYDEDIDEFSDEKKLDRCFTTYITKTGYSTISFNNEYNFIKNKNYNISHYSSGYGRKFIALNPKSANKYLDKKQWDKYLYVLEAYGFNIDKLIKQIKW